MAELLELIEGSDTVELKLTVADTSIGSVRCSASIKRITTVDVQNVLVGSRPARDHFSKAQRAFYKAHAAVGLKPRELCIVGPTPMTTGTPRHPPRSRLEMQDNGAQDSRRRMMG